jgi:hypothetical protein
MLQGPADKRINHTYNWRALFHLTIFSVFFYTLTEWLFFMTRPSSLSILAVPDATRILFVTAGAIALVSIALLAVLFLPSRFQRNQSRLLAIAAAVPAFVLSVGALMVLDNLTDRAFHFGVISTHGILRGIYGLGFLLFSGACGSS